VIFFDGKPDPMTFPDQNPYMRLSAKGTYLPKIGKSDTEPVLFFLCLGHIPQTHVVSRAEVEKTPRIFSPKENLQVSA
jgi:hypothetical protein